MGVKKVATGSMRANSNASAVSRASHPSQPDAGKARKRRARKYPRKSDATVAAVSARPRVVWADDMSVISAGLRLMITQSGEVFGVFGVESRREILHPASRVQDDELKDEHGQQ